MLSLTSIRPFAQRALQGDPSASFRVSADVYAVTVAKGMMLAVTHDSRPNSVLLGTSLEMLSDSEHHSRRYVYVCVYTFILTCISMYFYTYVCMYISYNYITVYVHLHVHVHMCICTFVHVHVYMYM